MSARPNGNLNNSGSSSSGRSSRPNSFIELSNRSGRSSPKQVTPVNSEIIPSFTSIEKMKLGPKAVCIALLALSPSCFLATAALQQLRVVERAILPFLYTFFSKKDIPFAMAATMFFWAYVFTASMSIIAQAAGFRYGYDNSEPRHQRSSLKPPFGRMVAAHQAALESVPGFFAAIIIAWAKQVSLEYRISFSVIYAVLRIIHTPLYIMDLSIARTITHVMAISCCVWLFAFALIPRFEKEIYSSIMDVVTLQRSVNDGINFEF